MVVVVLTACPAGLRGFLTRWLLEISPGVFVGRVSARVRDQLWDRIIELVKDGKALMVFQSSGEQGLDFKTHRHDWQVQDVDGLALMLRPAAAPAPTDSGMRKGWSKASKYRRAQRLK
ncbi:type I-E CRISPR-associated endoribonuclease Cas2e [Dermacoccaceae bacterium W4C1]